MALLKNIKYPNGTESNYHKISEIHVYEQKEYVCIGEVDNEDKWEAQKSYKLNFRVFSYVSQEIRTNNNDNYVVFNDITVTASLEEIENTPIIKLAYNKLKDTETFANAEDV